MKIKNAMIVAALLLPVLVAAQQPSKNCLSVRYQFTSYENLVALRDNPDVSHANQQGAVISYGRMVSDTWEVGVGCGLISADFHKTGATDGLMEERLCVSPNVFCKLHLLSMMGCTSENVDLSLNGRIGGTFANGCNLEYGFGLGGQYFPLRHIGITCQADFGKFTIARYGVVGNGSFQVQGGLAWRW